MFAALILFTATGSILNAQTKWLKYEGNPVLDVGTTWDAFWARIDGVIPGDTMKMWYSASSNGNPPAHTGYAASVDGGITWQKHPDPVLSPSLPWDGLASFRPYVMFSQSEYKMWYTGLSSSFQYRIGFATSPNGVNWTKRADPVLGAGGSGWWANGVQHPSVIEDSTGGFKMWMQGSPSFVFGYSEAVDETTWTPPVQVFSDADIVYYPRVIFNGQFHEMWYSITNHPNSRFKYATSLDGINWTISPDNPVLRPGPQAWDAGGIIPGDIHFDGSMYHMWYQGLSASRWRSGYAVSPKGMAATVTPTGYLPPGDTVWVTASVDDTTGLFFLAEIESPDGTPVDSVVLNHVGSGVFTNYWIVPPGMNDYFVDLKLRLQDTLTFEMDNIGTFTTITSVSDESGLPGGYYLEQNYPNPFNPSTVIRYSLPVTSYVTLKVYNMLGQEVATLMNEEMRPGSYEVTWDASGMARQTEGGLASGVYLYRLQAGGFSQTRKLVLLRCCRCETGSPFDFAHKETFAALRVTVNLQCAHQTCASLTRNVRCAQGDGEPAMRTPNLRRAVVR